MTQPAPNVDLATAAEAVAYLKAHGEACSGDIQALLTAVSAQIQSYLSRNIPSQSYTVTLDGVGGSRVSLPNTPITAVDSVSVDGLAIQPAASPTCYGFVFSKSQVLLRGAIFSRGVQNITIEYTAGYATVPADIKLACLEGILAIMGTDDPRATSLKAGNSAIEFGDLETLAGLCLTQNVTGILNQYRRVAPV